MTDVYGCFEPSPEEIWRLYEKGRSFKETMGLFDTVATNENFFIGKQWEGVSSNGLPTPVFNILKRDVCFVVSNITSDNLTARVSGSENGTERLPEDIINGEVRHLMEQNNMPGLLRTMARDAAVRGDGCLYTYWDSDKGRIVTEPVENTRVYFGNPNDRRVQTQPYIIIESRQLVYKVRREAMDNSEQEWESIMPDDDLSGTDETKRTDDKVTVLLMLWADSENGEIYAYETTKNCPIRRKWSLGISRYPLVWMNWDRVSDSYHGQAMITGLIPNQIFINKAWAMSMLSLMTTAYPKVIYDKTRIAKWDNRVGAAIAVSGGDMSGVARVMDPASVSPQIAQFIQLAVDQTNRNLGATSTALGDTRPDNTSAIIAMQRAAAVPSEITKQALHDCLEEQVRVYLEFMAEYYGLRLVSTEAGMDVFTFDRLKKWEPDLKIDVGASSYYSEIAAIQTLDNLLHQGRISTVQYLKRIPDGYIPDRRGLLSELQSAGEA